MAYDNQSFIQKLRQNQILRPEGQGLPNPYIGMPNFMTGRQQELQQENGGGGTSVRLPQNSSGAPGYSINPPIDNSVRMQVPGPLDHLASAWEPGAADINAGRIVKGETPNEVTGRALALQQNKNALGWGNLGIKSRAQDLKELIQSGRATDEEKHEYALGLIEARGDEAGQQIAQRGNIQRDLLNTRGEQATGLQELKGTQQSNLQGVKGEQRLNEIAQRALGRDEGMKPSQELNAYQANLSRLMLENPDLAQSLVKDPNTGQWGFKPGTSPDAQDAIRAKLLPSRDVNLPSSNPSYNNNTLKGKPATSTATPGSTTPKADGQTPVSKYKVTVR